MVCIKYFSFVANLLYFTDRTDGVVKPIHQLLHRVGNSEYGFVTPVDYDLYARLTELLADLPERTPDVPVSSATGSGYTTTTTTTESTATTDPIVAGLANTGTVTPPVPAPFVAKDDLVLPPVVIEDRPVGTPAVKIDPPFVNPVIPELPTALPAVIATPISIFGYTGDLRHPSASIVKTPVTTTQFSLAPLPKSATPAPITSTTSPVLPLPVPEEHSQELPAPSTQPPPAPAATSTSPDIVGEARYKNVPRTPDTAGLPNNGK